MGPSYEIIGIEFWDSNFILKLKYDGKEISIDLDMVDLMKHIFIGEYKRYKMEQFVGKNGYNQEYLKLLEEKIEKFNEDFYKDLDIYR